MNLDNWHTVKLGQILALIRNGYSGNQVSFATQFPVTRIEAISYSKVNYERVGYVENIPESYRLSKGDILLSNINSIKHIGKVAQYEGEQTLYHGMNLLILRFEDSIDETFIRHYLDYSKPWFEKMASHAINQASINQTTLRDFELTIPKNKTEQTHIAYILSVIDRAIEQTETIIEKQIRIKLGLMQALLTKGIDSNGNIRSEKTHEFKDSGFGRIPVEWFSMLMSGVCQVRQGLQIAISKRYKEEGENRFVYITVQHQNDPDRYLEYIHDPPAQVTCRKTDVLFTRTGNTGQIITDVEGVYHNNFFKLDINKSLLIKDYLIYFLRWQPVQDLIMDLAGTTTIPDLNHGDFYSIPIFFPKSKDEQELIVNILRAQDYLIKSEQSSLVKMRHIKSGLMQDLLTGKVPVTE
jgi:type I restriction enzyme S subunit